MNLQINRVKAEWNLLKQKTVFASASAAISKQCLYYLPKEIATSQAPRYDSGLALSKCHCVKAVIYHIGFQLH